MGIAFLLLVSLVISTALSFLNHYLAGLLGGIVIAAQVINIVVSICIITLVFAMIFKILPDVNVTWRDVWIGALVTAILFTIGRYLLSLYLSSTAMASAYGAAGSLVILLLWVYYPAQILFIGAEFTQVYARHTQSAITPNANAHWVNETERANRETARRQPAGQRVQDVMMPVTGQPEIHPEASPERSKVRYEAPDPNTVIPVIAAGALAGIITVTRIVREFLS